MIAGELQIGDSVRLSDGSYGEVIDLRPAALGRKVAVTVESEPDPFIVPVAAKVQVSA